MAGAKKASDSGPTFETSSATTTIDTSNGTDGPWHALIHWDDLPHWLQDNHFIHSSYRQASYSYGRSLQSILHWHNESVNIWTHLVPAVLSLPAGLLLYQVLKPRYEQASTADVVAMSFFFCGAATCLGMSSLFHTMSNHSPPVARFWNQLDYAGISALIAGSFIPSIYYGFWCQPVKQWTYWSMVSVVGVVAMLR